MPRWVLLLFGAVLLQSTPAFTQEAFTPDPEWQVARAQFTTRIVDREPTDRAVVVRPPVAEIYFFTDLRHLQGRTITHRWEYEGQLISLVPFEVNGPRWRVYSKKEIKPEQIGEWSVTVLDESGWPLHTELFRYESAAGSNSTPVEPRQISGQTADQPKTEETVVGMPPSE